MAAPTDAEAVATDWIASVADAAAATPSRAISRASSAARAV